MAIKVESIPQERIPRSGRKDAIRNAVERLAISMEMMHGLSLLELVMGRMFSPFTKRTPNELSLAKKLYSALGPKDTRVLTRYYNENEISSHLCGIVTNSWVWLTRNERLNFEDIDTTGPTLPFSPELENFIVKVREQTGEEFMHLDYLFLFAHRDGSNTKDLSLYLRSIGSTDVKSALQRGWLKGTKPRRNWHIPFPEVLRAISLARNWITVNQVSLLHHVSDVKLYEFAIENGYEVKFNLSGSHVVRVCQAGQLAKEYKHHVKNLRKGTKSFRRFSRQGETSPDEFGEQFGVSGAIVRKWIRRGVVKACKRKGCWFIQRTEIEIFAAKVIDQEIAVPHSVLEHCRYLLTEP